MKLFALVTAAIVGLTLGTSIAVANAGTPTETHAATSAAVMAEPLPLDLEAMSEARVTTIPARAAVGSRPKSHATAKTWTCSSWHDSSVGGKYKTCEWK